MNRNGICRLIGVFLSLILVFGVCFANAPVVQAEGSGISGLRWVDGSTATLNWGMVEGADYYEVGVYVSYKGANIGKTFTGTEDSKIDLQQEIMTVYGDSDYESVQVKAKVVAYSKTENGGKTKIAASDFSETLNFIPLDIVAAPKNVKIDPKTYDVTFDAVKGAVDYSFAIVSSDGHGPEGADFV